MSSLLVVQWILNERQAGNAGAFERRLVRPQRSPQARDKRAVSDVREPSVEHRFEGVVALQVDATDPAAAVVEIQVRRQQAVGVRGRTSLVEEVSLNVAAGSGEI